MLKDPAKPVKSAIEDSVPFVFPEEAGTQKCSFSSGTASAPKCLWIPSCAGMTAFGSYGFVIPVHTGIQKADWKECTICK